MMICPEKDVLIQFVMNELDSGKELEILNHLEKCRTCKSEIDEFIGVRDSLILKNEPVISLSVLKSYRKKLKDTFSFGKYENRLQDLFAVKILKYAAILFIGMVIGQYIHFNNLTQRSDFSEGVVSEKVYLTNIDNIRNYLQKTAILFLEIENIDLTEAQKEKILLSYEQNTVEELLKRTVEIRSSLSQTRKEFRDFLNSLEDTLTKIAQYDLTVSLTELKNLQERIREDKIVIELEKYKQKYSISRM